MNVGPFTLHDFQENAITKCRDVLSFLPCRPRRLLLVSPTGSGKSLMALAFIQGAIAKGATAAFITSGRQLILQMHQRLEQCGIKHSVLMEGYNSFQSGVVVASKDTLVARWGRIPWVPPRLCLLDECDVCVSPWWQKIMEGCEVVIGLTATPCLADGKGLGGLYHSLVRAATYEELIASKLLVSVKCFSPYRPDLRGVHVTGGDYNAEQLQRRMDRPQLIGDIYQEWKKHGEDRPTAIFATGVEHSIHLAEVFNGHGVRTEHLDGSTSDDIRQTAFDGLARGTLRCVVSCQVLGRGWDCPSVSCGVIAKPTRRLRTFLQMAGRIIRSHAGKPDAILIDHAGCVHRHGWPTDDHEWSLDPGVKIESLEDKVKNRTERELYCCPKCAAMWQEGNECPNCGFKHRRRGQPLTTVDGQLVQVKRRAIRQETGDEQQEWLRCLAIAAHRNGPVKMASAIFRQRIGRWPEQCEVNPMPSFHQHNLKVKHLYPGFVRKS